MAYTFYLDGTQLPVSPPALQVKIKNQNKSVTLINEGEVNVLKTAGLTEIKFDARIPQTKYPFADTSIDASAFLSLMERLKTSRKPFQFIVSRVLPNGTSLFDTNIKVSLEEYEINEDAEEGFDVVVSVSLKQYRAYGTQTVKLSIAAPAATTAATVSNAPVAQAVTERPAETAPQQTAYTVKSGDCLWNIAKKYLGDGSRYNEIYGLNKDKIKNPNLIYPGQVLVLPGGISNV